MRLSHSAASESPFLTRFNTALVSSGPDMARALLLAALFSRSVPRPLLLQARMSLLSELIDSDPETGPELATDLWNQTRVKGLDADKDSLALLCASLFEQSRWQEALHLWTASVREGSLIADALGAPHPTEEPSVDEEPSMTIRSQEEENSDEDAGREGWYVEPDLCELR
ncbi:hypothetical protein M427DRAFT_374208 [Gonapodya prolifera JEL478]|uniref:Uncharacterized protein n=1 Tax=Gonapodya prolifera (strain JEL478) TaxID=1344416 RepID=A0A139AUJ3_GONPJ|nr:hypothetical protein M427DRAFT_374208 [Gonapodya prolifera JEL478]|eukprot:KXS20379.1 hypothetical protein M427DRAFT_374208 [Gonapodya prolifera JEL478]